MDEIGYTVVKFECKCLMLIFRINVTCCQLDAFVNWCVRGFDTWVFTCLLPFSSEFFMRSVWQTAVGVQVAGLSLQISQAKPYVKRSQIPMFLWNVLIIWMFHIKGRWHISSINLLKVWLGKYCLLYCRLC